MRETEIETENERQRQRELERIESGKRIRVQGVRVTFHFFFS